MSMVKIEQLGKSFHTDEGEIHAVRDLELKVEKGAFFTLLGPSGCGKTTTLRCIAGLEIPDKGEIYIEDELVVSAEKKIFVPPHKRNIGMVFQSYAIWPHMDVFGNVAFPLKQGKNRLSKDQIFEKVTKALVLVRLAGLERRPATQLSGGQQQRLALARALVNEPKLLLLDEPLSNLDAKLREEMRIEIKELVQRMGITTFYVTHDQLEALAMSDRVNVMNNGEMIQSASPKDIYVAPKDEFVAGFIGSSNIIKGVVGETDRVMTGLGTLTCPLPKGLQTSDEVLILIRPEDIRLFHERPPHDKNIIEGVVNVAFFLGDSIDCRVSAGNTLLHLKLQKTDSVSQGDSVLLQFPPDACMIIQ